MFVPEKVDTCVNVLSFDAATSSDKVTIRNRIGANHDIVSSDEKSITFLSQWCPPLRLIKALSLTLPLILFTLLGEVDSQLASKSFYQKGLIEHMEVPFHKRESLQEFVWPRM